MNRRVCFLAALLAALWLGMASPVPAQPEAGIVGKWSASVLGQEVTASFTRQGDMIYGVIVIPDVGGGTNTYHVAGVILGAEFAAQHASGHLLKGTLTGPNTAEAVFSPKSGPSMPLHLTRRGP
ncbi:MAG: hypothetical protein ACLGQH_04765 [Acidobacteriota bacterium]